MGACAGAGSACRRGAPARPTSSINMCVRSQNRDALAAALNARGIGTNIHYPVPVHLQPAYRGRVAIGPGGLGRASARAAKC